MTLGIMQPYFLPYIGYFQLISACDRFVVYDNIKYTKKGWINRNRMLVNGEAAVFSLPLKSGSDFLNIDQREISEAFEPVKLLNQFRAAYRKAPCFETAMPLIEKIVLHPDRNLFGFIFHSLTAICAHLEIRTPLEISSRVESAPGLKGEERVLSLCQDLGASRYINAIGGTELYSRPVFLERGVDLKFIKSRPHTYPQFENPHVPWLSIVDVLMFNSADKIRSGLLPDYDLVENA